MKLKTHIQKLDLNQEERLSRVLFLIQQNTRRIEEDLIIKRKLNISHRELIYIVFLKDCQGMNMMDICDVMALSKGAFSKAVKALVTKGIVKKKRSKIDTRTSTLLLTKEGERAYGVYNEARQIIHSEIISKIFNEKEVENLYEIADKFIKSEK
ncbi:MarR family winged helix-turn-helix transcriptional regulator [Mycoplasma marinum]|uniref:HTH-type transcriptional regulator SarZ n=1 Tax=Mycoplasma marinum TaxID=1937190 RepID=A0A4R0XRG6_9MOLU|nr:MarR family winged helix-turn-helix transcriptional regulator [Mycoplasma marinum]TCG11465.1 hypothetical protein C4B24_01740 [Mycoplasma marinum]